MAAAAAASIRATGAAAASTRATGAAAAAATSLHFSSVAAHAALTSALQPASLNHTYQTNSLMC